MSPISSVPAERVLRRDRRRDELRPARVAHATPATAVAVAPAGRHGAIGAGKVTAEQRAAHKRRAAAAVLAHLGVAAADGAGTAVHLLLALVPAGNDKHDDAVRSSHGDCTADDTRGGAPLRAALAARVSAVAEGVAVGPAAAARVAARAAASTACSSARSIRILADNDGDCRVDLLREVVDELIGIVVQRRVGQLNIRRQSLDHANRVRHLRARCNVAKRALRIEGNQSLNLGLAGVETPSVAQSLGEKTEDLRRRPAISHYERVVVSLTETDLNQHGILRLCLDTIVRRNSLGKT